MRRPRGNPGIITLGEGYREAPPEWWGRLDWEDYEREREGLSSAAVAAIAGPERILTDDELRSARLYARVAKLGLLGPR